MKTNKSNENLLSEIGKALGREFRTTVLWGLAGAILGAIFLGIFGANYFGLYGLAIGSAIGGVLGGTITAGIYFFAGSSP